MNLSEGKQDIVEDGGGKTIKICRIGDRVLPPGVKSNVWHDMRNIPARLDDVIIAAYPKSGLHWLYEIVAMLREKKVTPMQHLMETQLIDFIHPNQVKELGLPRTLCSHRYPEELPIEALKLNCKIIQIVRNPKDVCVSYYHHLIKLKEIEYDGEFSDFIVWFKQESMIFNSWQKYFHEWKTFKQDNPDYPIFTIRYEDLKMNPLTKVKELAKFLCVEMCEEDIKTLIQLTSFKTMKKQKEDLGNPFKSMFKGEKEIMYRKGITGDWKTHFSPEEAREFDSFYSNLLDSEDQIYLDDGAVPVSNM